MKKNDEKSFIRKKNYLHLDYYLLLGRNYELTSKKDSAKYYYNYYIEKSSNERTAFNYLINLEIRDKITMPLVTME
jgi:hypothetical protein